MKTGRKFTHRELIGNDIEQHQRYIKVELASCQIFPLLAKQILIFLQN